MHMANLRHILFACFVLLTMAGISPVNGQEEFQRWQHGGPAGPFGTGTASDTWYGKPAAAAGAPVVVAVLDSGIDTGHVDLRSRLWVNPGEIPGNGIDDDRNGYIDDIHGWNFIGGADGQSVIQESFEVTRLYGAERARWANVDPDKLRGKDKKAYADYLERKELVESRRAAAETSLQEAEFTRQLVLQSLEAARAILGPDSLDVERLRTLAADIISNIQDQGVTVPDLDWLEEIAREQFDEQIKENRNDLEFHYNPDYDSRTIVGDDYSNFADRNYGNNLVDGEFAYHGTHVAGIIGAVRDNGLGMDGMADHVRLMAVKVVPDGDERDKDVANAVRYAVDNGAQVINMSFGKGYSPEKELVDDAFRYAARHDVLIVVGAGNEGANLDVDPKFPNDRYVKRPLFGPSSAKNVLSVGALAPEADEHCIAEFSNYGKKEVDVFAPGVFIYSTTPDGTYDYASGTSMASPVVAGMAALIRSRHPDLSAVQVKKIIMDSSRPLPAQVIQPGTFDTVRASDMCVTGGMVDVPGAMQRAAATKGKAKTDRRIFSADGRPMPAKGPKA